MSGTNVSYSTGTAKSGDVDVFFRHAGAGDRTPVIILHQANYFDSADWIPVIDLLAADRPVAALDARGFGRSTWSANKDYSHEANASDVLAVLDELGWASAVLLGAARGGAHGLLIASHFPERAKALILADYVPAIGIGHPGAPLLMKQLTGLEPRAFPTLADALAATAREQDIPEGSPARARAEEIFKPVPGGYAIGTRDPDFVNPIPLTAGEWPFSVPIDVDLWAELEKVSCPVLNVRVARAPAPYPPQSVERIARDFPAVEVVEGIPAGQDISAAAPREFAAAVRSFLDSRGI